MLLAIIAAAAAMALGASTAYAGVTFDGNFENGFTPWGSKPQCANYGTPSKSPQMRGNFYFSNLEGEGTTGSSGQFSLPANTYGTSYPLVVCDIGGPPTANTLPADDYYGLMIYVPQGWTIANNFFGGVNILELHFQNIDGAPVTLQLHPNHVTLAFETGPCDTTSPTPGCQFRSNADNPSCHSTATYTCGPGVYAIPPGAFVQGAWNEIILGIHWAADSSGQVQSWYRVKGAPSWTQGSSMSGHPTVQWDQTKTCCATHYDDQLEAYTAALTAPLSVWLDNEVIGTSFASVAATMPGGTGGLGGVGGAGGPGGAGGGTGGPGGVGGASAQMSALHISPHAFALSGRRSGRRCLPARRSNRRHARCARRPDFTVSYVLNTPATVSFTVTELMKGRSMHGRCISPSRAHGHGRPCQRRINVPGTIVRQGAAGLDAFTFAGRTDGHRLGPGSYILTATPIGATGTGRAASLRFSLLP